MNHVDSRKPPILRFALIGGGLMALAPFSIDMYLTAFSAIASDLQSGPAMIQLTLAIFFAGVTLGQLLYGPFTDRFGRKPPLIFGLSLFVLATLACLWVPNAPVLIILRLLQAVGASAGMVISQALVHDSFERQQAGRVFSALMLVMGVAPIVAPAVGTLVLSLASWRAIFGCLSIFGAMILVAVIFLQPETTGPNRNIHLSRVFQVYAGLLKKSQFRRITLTRSFANAGMFAYITTAPFVFMNILGFSAQDFAWVFAANALALMIGSQLNRFFLKRHVMEIVLHFSMILLIVCGAMIIIAGLLPLNFWMLFVPIFLTMLALGLIMPNATALGLLGHHEHTGSASALMGSLMFGAAFLVSSVLSALNNGSVQVMTLGIGACTVLSFASYFLLRPRARTTTDTQT